ncbi:DEAD/DEAH box helicase-like protein [Roseobacter sp. AzwK-3b]|uniref:DEAD/DEAH box helicase n=1 Tax=Roseobacter sp. AzwK-3b TaxID=351016 RepID=UPI00015695AD|nr:DEAD/DEAH box helicase [Roseobacter sp. AzwK-3b]EDM72351.1 DEAD/DEAH box helicase-like protein [Roseobacter sp. AzwK-3b]
MKQALANALKAQGYTSLTAVQEAVSAPELAGKDLLVSAQTGSGKTLGFGLAIAPGLFGEAESFGPAAAPLALVIAPTRELALQVKRELAWLFGQANAVLASTVGGMDMRDERRALERGAHIVVATPGRLRDHIMRGSIDLSALKAVVLDEADEMLDLGFREDLEFILEQAPIERQTLLFSATVPAAIAKLASNYQKDAIRISTASGTTQHADIEYRALNVSARDAENAIINVLRYYEAPNAIVFCNTRAMVNRLTTRLSNRSFSVVALSGELSQSERTHALQAMRDGRARVCVATDVAARGIDLPNLELVIHAELPTNQDTLLHRSGRTGRAGRKGVSALIVPPAARKKAQRLLGWAKVKAEWADAPSADEVTARDDERMLAGTEWDAEIEDSNRATVAKLTERFSAEQLAAAFVRLFRERHSAPEELSDVSAPPEPRAAFGPSVWFSVEGGRAAGAEPRRLLPMLCKIGALSREDIGAIRIQNDVSLVEIRQSAVQGFLANVGSAMTLEGGAKLTRLDSAPASDRAPRAEKPVSPKGKPATRPTPPADMRQDKPAAPGTTTPVDWNDDPKPRAKKPKPGTKPKPKRDDTRKTEDRPARLGVAGLTKRKPRTSAGAPSGDAPARGPKPPAGKPSSKKNRARQAAKAAASAATAKPRKPRTKS